LGKKIICTVTNDLSYDQRMIRICSSLARAGYQVELWGRQLPTSRPLPERPYGQRRLRCFFRKGKLFYLEYNLRLLLALLGARTDAICSVDLDTLLPGYLVARLRQKRLIYDAHEYFTEVPEVVKRPLTKWMWEVMADALIPRVRNAYTVGPALASIFRQRYGVYFETIRNVPMPNSRQETSAVVKADPLVLLYQGALNEGRGLEAAIMAMHHLEGIQLWLAGEGDLSEALRDLVRQQDLQDKVHFLGYVLPEDLRRLTPKAYLGLNLLENKGQSYFYSLANKAFDYIQAGVPSLQMAFPEYEALDREYSCFLLLRALEPEQIAAQVETLRQLPQTYEQLCRNCREAARSLHWEREELKLLDFYAATFSES